MKPRSLNGMYSVYAWAIISWQILLTTSAILLTLSPNVLVKIAGELLFGLCILQWFILEHDFGHGAFFKNRHLNNTFGLLASLFSLMPFFPWKDIHHSHHVWTGWRELDPTQPKKNLSQLPKVVIAIVNLCWKFWVPVFSLFFALLTFWNLKKLKTIYPQSKKRWQHRFSILFIVTFLIGLFLFFGKFMLNCWLPAFVVYIFVTDVLLLSQHTHLDYPEPGEGEVKPIKYILQPAYTRSVVYPRWVSVYLLYHFDKHGLHHQYPGIPFYKLGAITPPVENTINWLAWLKTAKKIPADILIFRSPKDTGIVI